MENVQTHTQLYTCGKSQSFLLTLGTLDTGTGAPAYINRAFLLGGGKPHTQTAYTRTHSQGNPLTYSHAPALCKCQTVGERVYLGVAWYFYTFLYCLSLSHTHTHTRSGSSNTAHPMKGKPWPWCTTSLGITQKYQNTWTFMLWDILSCLCKVYPNVRIRASAVNDC